MFGAISPGRIFNLLITYIISYYKPQLEEPSPIATAFSMSGDIYLKFFNFGAAMPPLL